MVFHRMKRILFGSPKGLLESYWTKEKIQPGQSIKMNKPLLLMILKIENHAGGSCQPFPYLCRIGPPSLSRRFASFELQCSRLTPHDLIYPSPEDCPPGSHRLSPTSRNGWGWECLAWLSAAGWCYCYGWSVGSEPKVNETKWSLSRHLRLWRTEPPQKYGCQS